MTGNLAARDSEAGLAYAQACARAPTQLRAASVADAAAHDTTAAESCGANGAGEGEGASGGAQGEHGRRGGRDAPTHGSRPSSRECADGRRVGDPRRGQVVVLVLFFGGDSGLNRG